MNTTSKPSGLVYVFTGNGKGKTSAALGTAVRASAAGLKVAIVQWYKNKSWGISEHQLNMDNVAIYPMGEGFYFKDKGADPIPHQQAAAKALAKATSLLHQVDVLILDEINNAVADQLIDINDVLALIKARNTTHIILTGRSADPQLITIADLVTEMKNIKHPYDQGKLAVKGLDF